MKKTMFSLILLFSLFLTSCSDWFDVNPQTESREEEVFSTQRGFYESLMGIYLNTSNTYLYGRDLNYYFPDLLANYYTVSGTNITLDNNIRTFNFEDANVEKLTVNFWTKLYEQIINCNNLLKNLEQTPLHFPKNNKEILTAEVLALRAYFHLDLLRLYGTSPQAEGGMDALAIPYADRVSLTPFEQLTTREVLSKIEADFTRSKELLKDTDPLFVDPQDVSITGASEYYNDNGFRLGRKYRMNYWAVTGLLARTCLYKADSVNAYKNALEVYNSNYAQFPSIGGYMWNSDHIASFYTSLSALEVSSSKSFSEKSTSQLNLSTSRREILYENAKYPSADIRNTKDWAIRKEETTSFLRKYSEFSVCKSIIKRAEICLILAEVAAVNADDPLKYLNALRDARGLSSYPVTDPSKLYTEIDLEFKKEFIGEGEYFYFLKRRNVESFKGANTATVTNFRNKYRLPMPDDEFIYGNIK